MEKMMKIKMKIKFKENKLCQMTKRSQKLRMMLLKKLTSEIKNYSKIYINIK
jgi:hypothetical protein